MRIYRPSSNLLTQRARSPIRHSCWNQISIISNHRRINLVKLNFQVVELMTQFSIPAESFLRTRSRAAQQNKSTLSPNIESLGKYSAKIIHEFIGYAFRRPCSCVFNASWILSQYQFEFDFRIWNTSTSNDTHKFQNVEE